MKNGFSWQTEFFLRIFLCDSPFFCECVCFSFQSNLAPCWVMTSIAKYNATHVVFLKKKRQLVKLGIAGASVWWWKIFFPLDGFGSFCCVMLEEFKELHLIWVRRCMYPMKTCDLLVKRGVVE